MKKNDTQRSLKYLHINIRVTVFDHLLGKSGWWMVDDGLPKNTTADQMEFDLV